MSLLEKLIVMRVNRLIAVVFIVTTAPLAGAQVGGENAGWSTAIAPYVSEASGSVLDANGATVTLRAAPPPTNTNAFGSISMRVPAAAHRFHRVTLTADLTSTDATGGASLVCDCPRVRQIPRSRCRPKPRPCSTRPLKK